MIGRRPDLGDLAASVLDAGDGRMRSGTHESGAHGSPERVPGAFFRAMGALFLKIDADVSREALAHTLIRRLETAGISYHVRTLKRQLSGAVSSVPPEVVKEMRQLMVERNDLATEVDIERALVASGIEFPQGERSSTHVLVERILPLAQLWLHLNADKSKRFLACHLLDDLGDAGSHYTVNSLQRILAGKKRLAQRAVHRFLLKYLSEHGVASEVEARTRAKDLKTDIARSLKRRTFVDAKRFRQLCRLWQFHHHEPSTVRLAGRLKKRLVRRNMSTHVQHLQKAMTGSSRRIRYAFQEAMEETMREEVRGRASIEMELLAYRTSEQLAADLRWVPAGPVAALAREWLAGHPGVSQRQLAIRVSLAVNRIGFSYSPSTVQPILGGWKKRARGFVRRALLEQWNVPLATRPRRERDVERARRSIPSAAARHLAESASSQGKSVASIMASASAPPPNASVRTPSVSRGPRTRASPFRRGHFSEIRLNKHPEEAGRTPLNARKYVRPRTSGDKPRVGWREFLRLACEYLPSADSPHLLPLLALRAERLYSIPRDEAEAQIRRKASLLPRFDHTSSRSSLSEVASFKETVKDRDGALRRNDDDAMSGCFC